MIVANNCAGLKPTSPAADDKVGVRFIVLTLHVHNATHLDPLKLASRMASSFPLDRF